MDDLLPEHRDLYIRFTLAEAYHLPPWPGQSIGEWTSAQVILAWDYMVGKNRAENRRNSKNNNDS